MLGLNRLRVFFEKNIREMDERPPGDVEGLYLPLVAVRESHHSHLLQALADFKAGKIDYDIFHTDVCSINEQTARLSDPEVLRRHGLIE